MPVSCREMVDDALARGYAVGQFNVNNLEWTRVLVETAQALRSPIILGVAEPAAKFLGGYHTVAGMVRGLLRDLAVTVPVALHLDHGSKEGCLACLDAGFSSVMYDGSGLPFEENKRETAAMAALCRERGVSLEAEVGAIGRNAAAGERADPAQCGAMASLGIAMLAAGVGNIHGAYPDDWPGLDWDTLAAVKRAVGAVPLVLHGGSGIPPEMMRRSIAMGVGKINITPSARFVSPRASGPISSRGGIGRRRDIFCAAFSRPGWKAWRRWCANTCFSSAARRRRSRIRPLSPDTSQTSGFNHTIIMSRLSSSPTTSGRLNLALRTRFDVVLIL